MPEKFYVKTENVCKMCGDNRHAHCTHHSHKHSAVSPASYLWIRKTHRHIHWRYIGIHNLRWRRIGHSWYRHGHRMPLATWYPTTVINRCLHK